jgi:hypothetical protein
MPNAHPPQQDFNRILTKLADVTHRTLLNLRLRHRMERTRREILQGEAESLAAPAVARAGAAAGGAGASAGAGAGAAGMEEEVAMLAKVRLGVERLSVSVARCADTLFALKELRS